MNGDFSIEAWIKMGRKTLRWRGKKMVVRDGWRNLVQCFSGGITSVYVDGVLRRSYIGRPSMSFLKQAQYVDEVLQRSGVK